MSKKMQFDREDYLKVNRKLSREEEIKTHGRPVRIGGVHKSKKVYDRKRSKAEMKKALPYLFLWGLCECFQYTIGFSKTLLILYSTRYIYNYQVIN